jgi:hypothetical protein
MAANLAAFVLMPFYLRQTLVFFYGDAADSLLVFYYVLLYVTGALCFLILNNLRSLFNLMLKDQPFVRETERRLMRMGIESFFISGMLVVKIFCHNSLMTITSAVVFLIAGLFCFVLSDLFRRAVDYKEENDLTV